MANNAQVSVYDMAPSCYRAFKNALEGEVEIQEWDALESAEQDRWLVVSAKGLGYFDDGLQDGTPFMEIAKSLHGFYTAGTGYFDQLSERDRLSWGAVARHMSFLAQMEEEDLEDWSGVEDSWRGYCLKNREKYANA
jgi:hypothetical protein